MGFAYDETVGPVRVVVTDRHGGVSVGAYASRNLGEAVGDDPAAVQANLAAVAAELGVAPDRVHLLDQVHGARVVRVAGAAGVARRGEPDGAWPVGDALVTTLRDHRPGSPAVALGVRAADCAPVALADPDAGVVAAAHAGRRGLVQGVLLATVDAMRRAGAREIRAWVGPAICGCCYELPERLVAEVAAVTPEARSTTRHGTPGVDIQAASLAQLAAAGVRAVRAGGCTYESPDLYSHRRDGVTGRFAAFVVLTP